MSYYYPYYNPQGLERQTIAIPYGTPIYQPGTSGEAPVTTLPTGVPSGPPYGGTTLTATGISPVNEDQAPSTVQNPYYTAGYLKQFIGKEVRVEFLIGTGGSLSDRIGTLMEVGASYIVLRPFRTNDLLICDLYSIKFVTVFG